MITTPLHEGTNYSGYRDGTAIAKDIRADIKQAKKEGRLPADVKVSVRTSKFSGGQAIDCVLSGWDASAVYVGDDDRAVSAEARQARDVVEAIRNSYNLDFSDPMIDHYDVTYFGGSRWDWRI